MLNDLGFELGACNHRPPRYYFALPKDMATKTRIGNGAPFAGVDTGRARVMFSFGVLIPFR